MESSFKQNTTALAYKHWQTALKNIQIGVFFLHCLSEGPIETSHN